MPTRIAVVRGVEQVNAGELGVYAELGKAGYAVELLCSTKSRITEAEARMPVRRRPPPALAGRIARTTAGGFLVGLVSPYRYYHQYLTGFSAAVRDVDVLCPVDLGHPTSYQALEQQRFGKRVVVQCWEDIPFNWPHNRPLAQHFEAVLDRADHFLAFSRDAAKTLGAMGVGADRLSQVNIGLDLGYWRPDPPARADGGPLRALFVGRLQWAKGVQTIIEAMDALRVAVEVTIVGAGPDEARLRWLIEQRRRRGRPAASQAIRFVGPQFGADLLRLRQSMDVQIVPSIPTPQWREQLNQSMLEAMACGLPPIASNSGAIPEAVTDGDNGWLFGADRPDELADRLERAAADPAERARRGASARARMEREYELVHQGARLAEIFRTKVRAP
ncbi:MAG TPA: glycosyltransferase family 4 protein [Thermoplasmata archaeon]|nr:glycosyltransferase family 4 protein [Thermoplasmata archaeon]